MFFSLRSLSFQTTALVSSSRAQNLWIRRRFWGLWQERRGT